MKKRILLFTLSASIGILSLSSYENGPASVGSLSLTGANGTSTSCGGGGCHGGTNANTTVSIVVDTVGGGAVTKYKPGGSYTVVITGHNTSSLSKFGYQFAAVTGSSPSQVAAGTPTAPSGSHTKTIGSINIVEHSAPLSGTSGTYTVSIPWTAPAAGKGTVTMYCTLNAVNGNSGADAPDVNGNTSITLSEGYVGVPELANNIEITAYPNPTTSLLNIKMGNAMGTYAINVFDITGRKVYTSVINAAGSTTQTAINCSNWSKGNYAVQISQNGAERVLPVVKL